MHDGVDPRTACGPEPINAIWVFAPTNEKSRREDKAAHKAFNSDNWTEWFQAMIPVAESEFPGKTLVIHKDNAKYSKYYKGHPKSGASKHLWFEFLRTVGFPLKYKQF